MFTKGLLLIFAIFASYGYCVSELPDESCETLPSDIHITKEEFDELGRLQRTCNGEVAVNKCEGSCKSQVQPSVITPTGESYLRERIVTLTHCYDPDGLRLTGEGENSMDIKLREPSECKCYKCGDFSR
ncbi:hypothetical protein D910_10099 [Dendroctonus ponderosae]|uniref:Partner of bursicon n=1 Tax=Dendroctonus ponderosae TaxID=77166 RepID=U4URL1_DENPD|nr:hypothetical protein D910_10099 [Dendroctonus ponderosae]